MKIENTCDPHKADTNSWKPPIWGPTPFSTNSYKNTGKYWKINGALEKNMENGQAIGKYFSKIGNTQENHKKT